MSCRRGLSRQNDGKKLYKTTKTMKTKRIGKKGAMLLYLVSFGLVLAFFAFLTITIIQRPLKGETKYIGEHQIAMLKTSMRAEKSLLYVDQAAKIAVPASIMQLAEIGGVYSPLEEPSECGSYYEYSSWQSNTEKGVKACYPSNIEMGMKRFTESWLSDMFGAYDGQELNDYAVDYYFKIDTGKVAGIASAPLNFRIVTAIGEETVKTSDVLVISPTTYSVTGAGGAAEGDVVPIPPINGESVCLKTAESCMLKKAAADTIPTIYKLFEENGCKFRITSSYRTEEQYAENWYGEGARKYPDESKRRAWYCGPKDGSFKHCPHYTGLAIDFDTIGSGCSYEKRIQLMCQAGWVNYHNERWHFEYKTDKWQNAMANGICQWPPVATESDDRGEFRAGHAAIKNDFITPEIITDISPSIQVTPTAGDSDIIAKVNKYSDFADKYGEKYGVAPKIVKAMIAHESHGDPNAISYTGCVGLGQFCYQTATSNEYDEIFGKVTSCGCGPKKTACKDYHTCYPENDDRFDPEKSIEAAAKYLSGSFEDYEGSIYLISISYNAGPAVADEIEKNLGDLPRTYENIRRLLDAAVLKYHPESKIQEADNHMRGVAHYYQLFGGQADQQTFSTIVDGKERTYIIDVIGEYSVYPSFSVETGYDFGEYDIIAGQIKGDAGSSGMNDMVAGCRNKGNDESDCVGSAIEEINSREKMKSAGLKMFNGPCDPKENLWSDFVEGFGRCIGSPDNECGCAIRIKQAEQNIFTESIKIKIEPTADGTSISTDTPKLSETFSIKSEQKEIDISDGSTYYIMKTAQGIKFVDKQPEKLCSLPKTQHKICVMSDKKLLFYDNVIKNAYLKNVIYKFAIGFQ